MPGQSLTRVPGPAALQFWREEVAPHVALLPALSMLRQVAGPLIESLILADRALFLLEPPPLEGSCCESPPSEPGPCGRGNLCRQQQPSQPSGRVPEQQAGGSGERLEAAGDEGQQREDGGVGGGCRCGERRQQGGHCGPGLQREECGSAGSTSVQVTEGGGAPLLSRGSLGLLGGVAASSGHVQCTLLPVFDPVVSPRNVALIAIKTRACCGCGAGV